jgi:primosomal protein N' (replication factor Y)
VVVTGSTTDQLSLTDLPPAQARRRATSARKRGPRPPSAMAETNPIARVAVDISLPHLDRLFDYRVTEAQDASAVPGARVRVRFAGQLVDGFILERRASTPHEGRLSTLQSVVSPLPVLTPEVSVLARAVADRYCGSLVDVLRLAIPARHASTEREHMVALQAEQAEQSSEARPDPSPVESPVGLVGSVWARYRSGQEMIAALESGGSPRASWCALPGVIEESPVWVAPIAAAVAAASRSQRGSIVVVPDHDDVALVAQGIAATGLSPIVLTADAGPRERYRRWLQVLSADPSHGAPAVVVGTRAAVYAPVQALGLMVVWDDGNDLHAEPRAPYPHTREVAALRAHQSGAGLIVGGFTRTAESAAMVESGFLRSVTADRSAVRAAAPRVRASADSSSDSDPLASAARLPTAAWRVAHEALTRGPVLVQVPRRGYLPGVSCLRCGEVARCSICQGPLAVPGERQSPVCNWCGNVNGSWHCVSCGGEQLRSQVVGAKRTAEELGKAFPGVPVITSGGRAVRSKVASTPALVVATPGAEPLAPDGYAAALLLDAWALLGRVDLRATEEALRRWMAAAALVKSAPDAGQVVVVADASITAVQALVRWDPTRFADAELADRRLVSLPPAVRVAVLQGAADDVADLLARVVLPAGTEQLGPVGVRPTSTAKAPNVGDADQVRVVLRSERREGGDANALAAALATAQGERSVRKDTGWVTIRIDPVGWG